VLLWEDSGEAYELAQLAGEVTALSWRADGRAVVLGTESGGLYCYHL
jgi:hypothetical protein